MQSKIWSIRFILFLDVKDSNNGKPKDIGRDTPVMQGDNCFQPASEYGQEHHMIVIVS